MSSPDAREFYERAYSAHDGANQRWKALLAAENIKPLLRLFAHQSWKPRRVIDIGCGDGSLLEQLSGSGIGGELVGYEIAPSAVAFAAGLGIERVVKVDLFDGAHLPEDDDAFDVAILNFVLEHAVNPGELLAEAVRVAPRLFVSIILADTRWAEMRRRADREGGRIQRYDRAAAQMLLEHAGLRIVDSEVRYPSAAIAAYWSVGRRATARRLVAVTKRGLHRVAPKLAERWLAASFYCVAERRDGEAAPRTRAAAST